MKRDAIFRPVLLEKSALAKLDAHYSKDAETCDLCAEGLPLDSVWI